jgi:hypothetical protein
MLISNPRFAMQITCRHQDSALNAAGTHCRVPFTASGVIPCSVRAPSAAVKTRPAPYPPSDCDTAICYCFVRLNATASACMLCSRASPLSPPRQGSHTPQCPTPWSGLHIIRPRQECQSQAYPKPSLFLYCSQTPGDRDAAAIPNAFATGYEQGSSSRGQACTETTPYPHHHRRASRLRRPRCRSHGTCPEHDKTIPGHVICESRMDVHGTSRHGAQPHLQVLPGRPPGKVADKATLADAHSLILGLRHFPKDLPDPASLSRQVPPDEPPTQLTTAPKGNNPYLAACHLLTHRPKCR